MGTPEILIILGIYALVGLHLLFVHKWLGHESDPAGPVNDRHAETHPDAGLPWHNPAKP